MATKIFEPLDIPRFAKPHILNIDPYATSVELKKRLESPGFFSYRPMWTKMPIITSRAVSEEEIKLWWNDKKLINAACALKPQYENSGKWYRLGYGSKSVLGLTFRPSVRGIFFTARGPEAHIINARKDQFLSEADISFLFRAAYEEYCIDDPNDPAPVVVDISSRAGSILRSRRLFRSTGSDMMGLEKFEEVVSLFFEAAQIAGFPAVTSPQDFSADMFRYPRC